MRRRGVFVALSALTLATATGLIGVAGCPRRRWLPSGQHLPDTHAPRRWKSCPLAVAAHLRRRFPGVALVVFGHSHIPLDHFQNGQRIFNPGSPADRRRQPHGTLGVLRVAGGRLVSAQIIPVT